IHGVPFMLFIAIAGLLAFYIKPELGFYSLVFLIFYSSFTGLKAAALPRYLGTLWPAYLYASVKFRRTFPSMYQKFALLLFFASWGVYILLVQMNWVFMC
ncbi:MAG: hypothetical protein V1703_02605, partial [Candidatus Altiarchaeota archaeon]